MNQPHTILARKNTNKHRLNHALIRQLTTAELFILAVSEYLATLSHITLLLTIRIE